MALRYKYILQTIVLYCCFSSCQNIDKENVKYIIANLENKYSTVLSKQKKYRQIADTHFIQKDSLEKHLEIAYDIWKQTPWSEIYSKEIFRKYVLPYRIADEPLEYNWRSDAYQRNKHYLNTYQDSSIIAACSYVYQNIEYYTDNRFWGDPLHTYSANVRNKQGTCTDYAVYTAMIMRALGIPTALDFVPYWGDNNNGHAFNALLLPDGSCKGYNNRDDLYTTLHLSGKVPKIYRKEFEVQRNSSLYNYRDIEYIPIQFADHNLSDVTAYYDIPITDVTIHPTLHIPESHLAYLSVFSPGGWRPIAWGEYREGKILFTDVGIGYTSHDSPESKGENYGRGGLFIPICYTQTGDVRFLTYPFILQEKSNTRYLIPDTIKTENITLSRKFPRKRRIVEFAEKMVGGYFEVSNKLDFSDSEIIFFVNDTPQSHLQTIPIALQGKYRYVRFYKRRGGVSIGELGCKDKNGKFVFGKVISDFILQEKSELSHINDGDILSYFDISRLNDTWIGLDFGKPVAIDELLFCPRTDDNDVSPNDTYELFYWDKQWKSLGKQVAAGNSISYSDVPTNALLWLRNLTKGREERPFTYDGGKQIWW